MTVSSDATRDLFVTGLRNAHALEMQALQIMNRQVERLENYPEVEQALRKHIQETEGPAPADRRDPEPARRKPVHDQGSRNGLHGQHGGHRPCPGG